MERRWAGHLSPVCERERGPRRNPKHARKPKRGNGHKPRVGASSRRLGPTGAQGSYPEQQLRARLERSAKLGAPLGVRRRLPHVVGVVFAPRPPGPAPRVPTLVIPDARLPAGQLPRVGAALGWAEKRLEP
eukprot:5396626-Alexandrium_andersonii.AAC.1